LTTVAGLLAFLRQVWVFSTYVRFWTYRDRPFNPPDSCDHRLPLMDAFARRDPDRAETAIRAHSRNARQFLVDWLSRKDQERERSADSECPGSDGSPKEQARIAQAAEKGGSDTEELTFARRGQHNWREECSNACETDDLEG